MSKISICTSATLKSYKLIWQLCKFLEIFIPKNVYLRVKKTNIASSFSSEFYIAPFKNVYFM